MVYYERTSRRPLGGWAVLPFAVCSPRGAGRAGFLAINKREDQSKDPWWMAFARAYGSANFKTPLQAVADPQLPPDQARGAPDTCDSSTASPSVRSRSGSDATFEVPAPVPKRAKRAPTPADATPPRAAVVPKAPDSPFLPIKLP